MNAVSSNYRELAPEEVAGVAAELSAAWQDPSIPERQYEIVKPELENYRKGEKCAPFDALIRCMERLPEELKWPAATLLDVGASAGYYREVLRQNSWHCDYTACDYSPAFKALAEKLCPHIKFDVADARNLPYADNSFDIVLSGCCMLHLADYPAVIRETARVASRFAIFNKTPVLIGGETKFYEKEGYGQRMLEIHFGEYELHTLFNDYGLELVHEEDVYDAPLVTPVYRTYLLNKVRDAQKELLERQWERA